MKDLKVIKKKQNDLGSKRKKIQEILNSNKIDKINKKILESMLEDIGEKDVLLKEELQLLEDEKINFLILQNKVELLVKNKKNELTDLKKPF